MESWDVTVKLTEEATKRLDSGSEVTKMFDGVTMIEAMLAMTNVLANDFGIGSEDIESATATAVR